MRFSIKPVQFLFSLIFVVLNTKAQVLPGYEPLELQNKSAVDSYGIDLISLQPMIKGIDLSIGTGMSGISITDTSFNGLRISYSGSITYMQSTAAEGGCEFLPEGLYLKVSTGKSTTVFKFVSNPGELTRVRGVGSLEFGTISTFKDLDGTEYKFENFKPENEFTVTPGPHSQSCINLQSMGVLTKVIKPNGEILDIGLENATLASGSSLGVLTYKKFTSVKSSLGWIFKREEISESGSSYTVAGLTKKTMFLFANLAVEYCNYNSSGSCHNTTMPWAKYLLDENFSNMGSWTPSDPKVISYTGDLYNPNGKKTKITYKYNPTKFETVVTSPEGLTKMFHWHCFLVTYCAQTEGARKVVKYYQGGVSFSYGMEILESSGYANQGLIPRKGSGPEGKVLYNPALPSYPYAFYDNKNRIWGQNYASNSYLLKEVGYQGDSRTIAEYDDRGNVTLLALVTKNNTTGSSIGGLIVLPPVDPAAEEIVPLARATYPDATLCSTSPKICNKPTTITDQAGITTTYTYHAHSGYVATITKPAVNGIQAQTRYQYEQKTPYVKNSSGNLVANPAVWVLTEVSECLTQTLASCVGTADEKKTIYSDFTNNLLPQKMTLQNGNASIRLETVTEYDI